MLVRFAGLMVSVAVLTEPSAVAVIVAEVEVDTATVVTVNVVLVAPAAIVTEAGTVALELLELKLTVTPPDPAALGRLTVPVEEFPPATVVGLRVSPERPAVLIVRVAVWDVPE